MGIVKLIDIVSVILALLIAIIGHEIMHGRMAYLYGDNTAKEQGRFSINPIKHIDLVGTIILPTLLYISHAGFMFGWAKPVPINMQRVLNKGGYFAGIQVSLAGIYFNFFIALISLLLLKNLSFYQNSLFDIFLAKFLLYSVIYNIVLGIFNLFPIPPLDGSKALMFLFLMMRLDKAAKFLQQFEQYGMIVLIILIATPLGEYIFYPINFAIRFILSL